MLTDKIKQLAATRLKVARIEATIIAKRDAELAELPAKYGFAGLREFVIAVREASDGRRSRKSRRLGRRKRAEITGAKRARVCRMAKKGKTGQQIADAVGISVASVNGIKKQAGLTKPRKE